MRMWGIYPKLLCRKHLLGEHLEIHMFVGCILKGKNIEGYKKGLVNILCLNSRHHFLAEEMMERGYHHNSPLPSFHIPEHKSAGYINIAENIKALESRCPECKEKIRRSQR